MLEALKEIAAYQSPEKLRRDSEKDGEFNGDLSTEK